MNPLRNLFTSSKHKAAQRELLALVKKHRPLGLELPANDPEIAAVAMALVKQHPELQVLDTKRGGLTLIHRDDLDPTLSPETKEALDSAGFLITKDKVNDRG